MFTQHVEPMVKNAIDYLDTFKPQPLGAYTRDELIKLHWQYHQRFKSFKIFSVTGGNILDVGGGSGGLFFWKDYLLPNRKDLKMSVVDMQKGEFFHKYEKHAILNLDTDELPFEKESFDCVILSHLIEHVKDWKLLLQKINKVLKPNGVVYIETPSMHTVNLPSKKHYIEKGFPCTTINFFDDHTHIAPVDLDEIGAYVNPLNLMTLEKGYCRNVFLENLLLSYGHQKNDMEVSQYGLWSKLLFSSYIILQKM